MTSKTGNHPLQKLRNAILSPFVSRNFAPLRIGFFLALLPVLSSGCASDVANRYYGTVKYPARPVSEVEILHKNPSRSFTVLADFQSRGETPKDMQKKAAAIGADAVIVTILGGLYDTGEQWAGNDSNSHTYSRICASAIKYNP